MKVRLIVTSGCHVGRQFDFEQHATFVVGRASYAHLRFPEDDPYVSRAHFLLELNPPACRIVDLDSTNGTKVNGQSVTEAELRDGDTIEAGETGILVVVSSGVADDNARATLAAEPLAGRTASSQHEAPPGVPAGAHEYSDPLPSDVIGGYRVVRELGQGVAGTVYLAEKNGQQVALKVLTSSGDDRAVRRFLREVSILKTLRHPAIVQYIDVGRAGSRLYLAMEYVSGTSLETFVTECGHLTPRSATRVTRQILAGLDHAHQQGFVHRDINPGNILLDDMNRAHLADFGLARSFQATMLSGCTLQEQTGRKLAYAAPEQILDFGGAVPANDIYSTGATLYRLLCGQPVYNFPDNTMSQRLRMLLDDNPIPLGERTVRVPPELAAIVDRCLLRNPDQRWKSARELHDALEPFTRKVESRGHVEQSSHPQRPSAAVRPVSPQSAIAPDDDAVPAQRNVHSPVSDFPEQSARVLWRVDGEYSHPDGRLPHRGAAQVLSDGRIIAALGASLVVVAPDGEVECRSDAGSAIIGSPAVGADGIARVHLLDGRLLGWEMSGGQAWTPVDVGEPLGWASPLVDAHGNCWICSSGGGLVRVDGSGTPGRRPFFRSLQRFDCTGVIVDDRLYVGAEDACVYAIDLSGRRGKNHWDHLADRGRTNWYINGRVVLRQEDIVVTSGSGTLCGFSVDGEKQWEWTIPGNALGAPAVSSQGWICQGITTAADNTGVSAGMLICFDPDRNQERWRVPLPHPVESSAVTNDVGNTYVGDLDGAVYCAGPAGEVHWQVSVGAPIRSTLVLHADKRLLVVSDNATLTAISLD